MHLFWRRPLCLSCFIFAVVCLACIRLDGTSKTYAFAALMLLVIGFSVYSFITRKRKKGEIARFYIAFALVFASLAVFSSVIGIDLPQKRADELIGERAVKMSVLEVEYASDYSSAYTVRIENADTKRVSHKALLMTDFDADLAVGDVVYSNVRIIDVEDKALGISGESIIGDDDVWLTCTIDGENNGYVSRFDRSAPLLKRLMAKNGVIALLSDIRASISEGATVLLGALSGSLACGFLIGDTSSIPYTVIRDFRRSGVSHLLAVSGMHISILLGAVELVFRRLYIPKWIRCITVSLLAFVLLALTGFSMSAMRAVIMLWIAYLFFMFSEEADAPTVLFSTLFIILLIFPTSVYDIGLWMSFLATLGLITLYPVVAEKIPKRSGARRGIRALKGILRALALSALLTVVANAFLLYIMCAVFGELSLSALPANLLLSPISVVFMFMCVAAILLGKIPLIGDAMCVVCEKTGELIAHISSGFSRLEWSVISLRPVLIRILVIAFTVSVAAVLVAKIKRKWLVVAIPLAFAVAFAMGVTLRYAFITPYAEYNYTRGEQTICVSDGKSLSVVDMSDGSYEEYSALIRSAKENGATEIDTIVFTDIKRSHLSAMKYIFRREMVRNISIPYPENEHEIDMSIAMTELAGEYGVCVSIYGEEPIKLLDGIYASSDSSGSSFVLTNGEYTLSYVDARYACKMESAVRVSNAVIFSGAPDKPRIYQCADGSSVIYASSEVFYALKGSSDEDNSYVNVYDELSFRIKFK